MIFKRIILFILPGILINVNVVAQNLVINEFMASNATILADESGDFPDWLEIYNPGDHPVHLLGWSLTDRIDEYHRWFFPDTIIQAKKFLLVWASGKNKSSTLHTHFKINVMGETVRLIDPNGITISQITPALLATDISSGRYPDGSDNWVYYNQPTPRYTNSSQFYTELLTPPIVSHQSGMYTELFYLKVSHPSDGVTIRYTLDGSVPGPESEVFPDSLLIANIKNNPDFLSAIPTTPLTAPEWFRWYPPMDTVFKGTNIRLKAFREGSLSPFTETKTYLVDQEIHQRYKLPVISISLAQEDLLGPSGIYTNFNRSGPTWEKQAHITFIDTDGSIGFSTDAGLRIHGGNSRRYALKSFRIFFRTTYGDGYVQYPLFPHQKIHKHDRLILRNGGSDWAYTYFRDAYVQNILDRFSPVDKQASRPSVVFINGEYWGIMNIRERFDDNYIKNYYGYENIDMLEGAGNIINYGSSAHYRDLRAFWNNNSLEHANNYEWVKTQMDVDNFRDYHILQVFSMNTDQPGKNVRFWRPRIPEGKWRWMWWDMDDSFLFGTHNNYMRNGLKYCTGLTTIDATTVQGQTPPPSWAPNTATNTLPLRALLGNTEFRISFINRFADLLNTAFQPQYLLALIDSTELLYKDHMYEHYRRWHRPTPEIRETQIQYMRDFVTHRQHHMREHIQSFFKLNGAYDLHIDIASGDGFVRVNSLHLNKKLPSLSGQIYPWQGKYFNKIPVELEAIASENYEFSHWEGDLFSEIPLIQITPEIDFTLKAHFIPRKIKTLISYWHFNDRLPNDTPLQSIAPIYCINNQSMLHFQSCMNGYPFDYNHTFWRKASMERRNLPTAINYKAKGVNNQPYDESLMRGLQIKQPFKTSDGENQLIFEFCSTGFKNLNFSFSAKNEGAAETLIIDYSTSLHDEWTDKNFITGLLQLEDEYNLYRIDFSQIEEINDNPHFRIRIRFDGINMRADQNNKVTFNNFSLEGDNLLTTEIREIDNQELQIYPNPVVNNYFHLDYSMDVYVYNTEGKLIVFEENTQEINISGLPSGMYFVRNQTGQSARIIILN